MLILSVVLGCALGGVIRHLLSMAVDRRCGGVFPWGTLVVNVVGCFLFGCLLGAISGSGASGPEVGSPAYAFAAIGFCGGLTTFSTFALQTLSLMSAQRWRLVGLNIGGGLLLCVLVLLGGYGLMERLLS